MMMWVDCIAGALAGVLVLMFSGWLSPLHALPREILLLNGATNLLYASYSVSLAVRATQPRSLIKVLVFANLSWALVCLCLAAFLAGSATVFGIGHLPARRFSSASWRGATSSAPGHDSPPDCTRFAARG